MADPELELPGFRFDRADEEVFDFYIKNMVSGKKNLPRHDPWELPGSSNLGEREWYFFVPRDRKYRSGSRPNRTAENGFWKGTGSDRAIVSLADPKRIIGLTKTLLFYKRGTKTYSCPLPKTHTAPAPGAPCDDGNCVPHSTQMPMAFPSNDPSSVGASIDADPNHIENPGDEPSSSTEASPAQPPDITSPLNGACDDSNHDSPSTQMPMELPSNDPAPVGVSSDDDHPNDFENPRDGNRDLEDDDPNDIENPCDGNRDLEDDDPNDENPHGGNGDLEAMHNLAIPKEVLLMFALQSFQILSSAKSNDISLLSRKAEILQYCAEALTVIGFFCGLGVILLRNQRNLRAATKIMSRIGFYITVLGFIATLCVPLGKFMFWILGFIGFLFSALYAFALWKGWIV